MQPRDFVMYKVLDDFKIEKKIPLELIDAYREKLPKQIIQIWEEYGFGSFMSGFLKTINPENFQDLLNRAYSVGEYSVPVFSTALGDLIVWEENSYLRVLRFRHCISLIMEKGCDYFLSDLADEEYVEEFLKPKNYYIALQNQGALKYDECFGYVPLLCLGGLENASQLEKVKLLEHLELILVVGGPIGRSNGPIDRSNVCLRNAQYISSKISRFLNYNTCGLIFLNFIDQSNAAETFCGIFHFLQTQKPYIYTVVTAKHRRIIKGGKNGQQKICHLAKLRFTVGRLGRFVYGRIS